MLKPEIADDIETLVKFANEKLAFKDWTSQNAAVAEAASRVEAYLATYQPEERIN